ncbi:MAG: DUF320 domain-containing protein, partial [Streptosporangiales bacterium]|nr:DUF320 domain-containing protein [Streptosporangiales bacterium]
MRMWAKSTTGAVLMAGFVAFGSGVGYADTTSGDSSAASGNQVQAPISAPVNVGGNAGTVGGQSAAKTKGGSTVKNVDHGGPGNRTSGDGGAGSGNQVYAPVSAPVDVSGNALSAGGQAAARSKGGASVSNHYNGSTDQRTSGDGGLLSGNQAVAPISAPISACGNAVSIFGQAAAECVGGAKVVNKGGGTGTTNGDGGALSGNQLFAPISAPVSICGNALAVAGQSFAACEGGAKVVNRGGQGATTSGERGAIAGNQAYVPISAPIDICGNAGSLFGQAAAGCTGGASVVNAGSDSGAARRMRTAAGKDGPTTSGDGSLLGGNQLIAPISAPINICGNALAVAGQAFAACEGGASVRNKDVADHMKTSGDGSAGGGNQVYAPVSLPVNICGNALAVAGQAAAMCEGGASVHNGSDGDA